MLLTKEIFDKIEKNLEVSIPDFNLEELREFTYKDPIWLHLGAGNIFRAFLGSSHQKLLNEQKATQGIIAVEGFDYEIVDVMNAYDNLTVNVTLKESGEVSYEVLGSIVDYLKMDPSDEDFKKIIEIFKAPSLQFVSFTITEKGYSITDSEGNFTPQVSEDFEKGLENVTSYIGKVVYLLHERYLAGKYPIALVSMDNMSHNGEKLANSVITFAKEWVKAGHVEAAFIDYLEEDSLVTFPWSMIDKITPRPDPKVKELLEELGFERIEPQMTARNSYVAPFVNGEETQYLIVEDNFPNGRPPLEETGIIFTDRETVNATEVMKVTACLNPLHTALAIYGCLLGYETIHEEMQDEDLVKLIKQLGYQEGLPNVTDPGIISPEKFIDEVIEVRLSNPFMPDTPQRIATDTSQKLSIRFGNTLKNHLALGKSALELTAIPLVYAGWLRYLVGIDDEGNKMELSPDPLLADLLPKFENYAFDSVADEDVVFELLRNEKIFGLDIVEAGLGNRVLSLLNSMLIGPGSVRQTLQSELSNL